MSTSISQNIENNYIIKHPNEAAKTLEKAPEDQIKKLIQSRSVGELVRMAEYTPASVLADWIIYFTINQQIEILSQLETPKAAEMMVKMPKSAAKKLKNELPTPLAEALSAALSYPSSQAGALMDRRILLFHENMTVGETIDLLHEKASSILRVIFVVTEEDKLKKYVDLQDLLFSKKSVLLRDIAKKIIAYIHDTDNKTEVTDKFDKYRLTDLPVVNYDGKFIGVIRYKAIVKAARDTAMTDMQTMVGVSAEERAMSPAWEVVKRRLPWLQVNLLTAFLAASVVGLFENVISAVTALAVLLPVVAGQSGNTGAQALAVTMRGIALREVFTSQWYQLLLKEFFAAFINGVAIAITTGLFVFLWSHSLGLVAIIFSSMIISMVIAAIAGTSIPLILIKLGMDPASSSSIILTTVTDVAGFFSFLGIASLLLHTVST